MSDSDEPVSEIVYSAGADPEPELHSTVGDDEPEIVTVDDDG
jgi:hypothetical protein